MRKQGTLVNDAPREEARSLCDAAHDQVSRLEVLFREIAEGRYQANAQIRGLGINMTQVGIHVAALLSTPGEVRPYHVRPREQHIPTRVVEMVMPPWLQKQAFEEALLKMEVEKRLSKHSSKFGYNPMSLSFENSQFIVPACVDFMHLNRRTVKKLFPEVHTCYCNVFTVPPGQLGSSYGLHHASTPGAEYAPFGKLGWFSPAFHMYMYVFPHSPDADIHRLCAVHRLRRSPSRDVQRRLRHLRAAASMVVALALDERGAVAPRAARLHAATL